MSDVKQASCSHDEIWKVAFLSSPQAMLITTSDERLVDLNQAAKELLNLESYDASAQKLQCILARLHVNLRKAIRLQRTSVKLDGGDFLVFHLQDTRDQVYSQRLLSFFATTLKALDHLDVETSCADILEQSARIALTDICDWCRIDLRSDLNLGRGTYAHKTAALENLLGELHALEFENADASLSPVKVIRSGISVFKENVSEELLQVLASSPRTFALLQHVGLSSYICVPVKKGNDTVGSMTFARITGSQDFDAIDLMMAEEFAGKVAVSIERALLYKNLAEMKNAAESANRAKTNFLANVSHEIRTPLGAILGFSELLASASPSLKDRTDWGNKIRNNSGHLSRIINDILDLSKVEVGRLDLEVKKIDFRNLLNDIYGFARSRVGDKNIDLQFIVEGRLPRFIHTDETRLSQVLSNIIGNAIKFTNQGYVRVKIGNLDYVNASDRKFFTHEQRIFFEVTDSGIGVGKAEASLLFQPFSQADSSHTRQFGGTGLGLALSRNLARGLGGDIVLKESEVGKGSTFLITINAGDVSEFATFNEIIATDVEVTPVQPEEDQTLVLNGRRVLLVEDSVDISLLVKRFLEGAGASVALADNGDEGVKAAQAGSYDVVLMDVQMPVKDGIEAARELRDGGYTGLIVALTANAMKEERERCLEAGYDAHLSKPMRRYDLIRNLSDLINQAAGRTSHSGYSTVK
ncbi:response regulator [Bdellovibrio sp. NC01]|uniref:response regulator n=1 Tax=Bdellovibrio sp. NC01 TaxID=2220073 RepID=UPI00352F44CF